MWCIFIDHGSISAHDRTICRNICLQFVFCDLIFVRNCCKAPDNAYRNFSCLKVLLQDIKCIDTSVFCKLCPEIECRIQIVQIAAKCICGCDNCCLCISTVDVSKCNCIITILDICPGSRCIFHFIGIGKESSCSCVCDHPFSLFAFCPVRNAVPVRCFISLYKVFVYCLCTKSLSDITDIFGSFFALCLEHLQFFCRRHIGICMCDSVFVVDIFPGKSPVGPGIWHTNGFYIAFFFCLCGNVIKGHGIEVNAVCCECHHRTCRCSC